MIGWSLIIRDGALDINTKQLTIHGYSLAQLILSYEPSLYHSNTISTSIPSPDEVGEELTQHQYQIFTALRDENTLRSRRNSFVLTLQSREKLTEAANSGARGLGDYAKLSGRCTKGEEARSQVTRAKVTDLCDQTRRHGLSGYVLECVRNARTFLRCT